MTKRTAAGIFYGATGAFLLLFVGLTIHSHTLFADLTNAEAITPAVLAGQEVWHDNNCVNCHTLLGEGAYFAPDLTRITSHRGEAYLTQFLKDPALFYSEEEHGRLMPNPGLSDTQIADVIAFLDWIGRIRNQNWPPRPILVSGSAMPGAYGQQTAPPASDDPVAIGEAVFHQSPPGCFTCHSVAPGVTLAGPSLAGVGARAESLVAAGYPGSATNAAEYIRESIVNPSASIAAGPPIFAVDGQSIMPNNYDRTLDTAQVEQLVAYLMTLR